MTGSRIKLFLLGGALLQLSVRCVAFVPPVRARVRVYRLATRSNTTSDQLSTTNDDRPGSKVLEMMNKDDKPPTILEDFAIALRNVLAIGGIAVMIGLKLQAALDADRLEATARARNDEHVREICRSEYRKGDAEIRRDFERQSTDLATSMDAYEEPHPSPKN